MKITVAIPAYNAARTIRATIDSVLCQTLAPEEILVVDDGSTDETVSILHSYDGTIKVIRQENNGHAGARNRAYHEARGELLAWIDADDLWHPMYLETQARTFAAYPDLAASFTAHVDFYGYGDYTWPETALANIPPEVINPVSFVKHYHTETGTVGSPSFMCVPRHVLARIGDAPFKGSVAADMYVYTWLPLLGRIGYSPARLGAYRITQDSMSSDRVNASRSAVHMFERMDDHYKQRASRDLLRAFESAFSSQRRHYAKRLMGVRQTTEAREQLRVGISQSEQAACTAKTLALLLATYMPRRLQPAWPSHRRDWPAPLTATDSAAN